MPATTPCIHPTLLGVPCLVAGLAAWVGMELPLLALTMPAIGASIIVELRARRG